MGSTGTDRLTDYTGTKRDGGGGGGGTGSDRCLQEIETGLEEVARSAYFKANKHVPKRNLHLRVVSGKRPTVQTLMEDVVGYLPTRYNYLLACMEDDYRYSAVVTASSDKPTPTVTVKVTGQKS